MGIISQTSENTAKLTGAIDSRIGYAELGQSGLVGKLRDECQSLSNSLITTWQHAEPLYRHVAATHPTFTSHGPDHILATLRLADQIMLHWDQLNLFEDEAYILAAAILLHDIGMVGAARESEEEAKKIRAAHHVLSAEMIRGKGEKWGLEPNCVSPIADVAAAHRQIDYANLATPLSPLPGRTHRVRTPVMAAILRLADELHVTADRVPKDQEFLRLPDGSALHFAAHSCLSDVKFLPLDKEIIVTGKVMTQPQHEIVKKVLDKVQGELSDLLPVVQPHGFPYEKVRLELERTEFIRKQVAKVLLRDGSLYEGDICTRVADGDQQLAEECRRFLGNNGPHALFSFETTDQYCLDKSEDVYRRIAKLFLDEGAEEEKLLFALSAYSRCAVTDGFLGRLACSMKGSAESEQAIKAILGHSPGAIMELLRPRIPHSRRSAALGSTGLLKKLQGRLLEDFEMFPSLLLEPMLLEEAFPDQNGLSQSEWEELELKAVIEYHKGLDQEALRQRWLSPPPSQIRPLSAQHAETFTINFTWKTSQSAIDPLSIMVASNRLGRASEVHAGEGLEMRVSGPDDGAAGKVAAMPENPHKFRWGPRATDITAGSYKARLVTMTRRIAYEVIRPEMASCVELLASHPFSMRVQELPTGPSHKTVTLSFNHAVADCEQAYRFARLSRAGYAPKILVQGKGEESDAGPIWKEPYLENQKSFLARLAAMQRILGERIPFPHSGVQTEADELLLANPIPKTKAEAKKLYGDLRAIVKRERRTVSVLFATVVSREGVSVANHLIGTEVGVHCPVLQINLPEDKREIQEKFNRQFSDPAETIEMNVTLDCDPWDAIAELSDLPRKNLAEELIGFFKDHNVAGRRPELARSISKWKWSPSHDHFWYDVTSFEMEIKPIDWELWFAESELLTREGDTKRAFFAALQAYKRCPRIASISLGWQSFLLNRQVDALRITSEASPDDAQGKYCKESNLAVFSLATQGRGPDRAAALEHLNNALDIAEGVETPEGRSALYEMTVGDLTNYAAQLVPEASEIMAAFADLRSGRSKLNQSFRDRLARRFIHPLLPCHHLNGRNCAIGMPHVHPQILSKPASDRTHPRLGDCGRDCEPGERA